jgi:hypothetical protein
MSGMKTVAPWSDSEFRSRLQTARCLVTVGLVLLVVSQLGNASWGQEMGWLFRGIAGTVAEAVIGAIRGTTFDSYSLIVAMIVMPGAFLIMVLPWVVEVLSRAEALLTVTRAMIGLYLMISPQLSFMWLGSECFGSSFPARCIMLLAALCTTMGIFLVPSTRGEGTFSSPHG